MNKRLSPLNNYTLHENISWIYTNSIIYVKGFSIKRIDLPDFNIISLFDYEIHGQVCDFEQGNFVTYPQTVGYFCCKKLISMNWLTSVIYNWLLAGSVQLRYSERMGQSKNMWQGNKVHYNLCIYQYKQIALRHVKGHRFIM